MGKHFGNLQKLKGVIYYTLSPHEINPMTMLIHPNFKDYFIRVATDLGPAVLPFTAACIIYEWGTTTYYKVNRKDPNDFKCDV